MADPLRVEQSVPGVGAAHRDTARLNEQCRIVQQREAGSGIAGIPCMERELKKDMKYFIFVEVQGFRNTIVEKKRYLHRRSQRGGRWSGPDHLRPMPSPLGADPGVSP